LADWIPVKSGRNKEKILNVEGRVYQQSSSGNGGKTSNVEDWSLQHGKEHGLLICGGRAITDMPTVVNWHAAFIKKYTTNIFLKINNT
jgi:hypothetical protein